MIAIGIRYLNGWSMAAAADGSDKASAEWPPHPDRLFMALAAAYFETDRDPGERDALLWLERQPPPELRASLGSEVSPRRIVTHYVPVNDVAVPRVGELAGAKQIAEGLRLLPQHRLRQPRQYPVAIPANDTVHFIWTEAEPTEAVRTSLASLCGKLTYLGHSASLVQGWLTSAPPPPTLRPTSPGGDHRLRVAGAGRLDELERAYNESERLAWNALEAAIADAKGASKKKLREEREARFGGVAPRSRRPRPARAQGYERVQPDAAPTAHSVFGDRLLMFAQVAGKRLWLDSTQSLMAAWRNTVMAYCAVQPPPEWVSGHRPDGAPSTQPHLAVVPIPNVGNAHAQGHLMGIALALPRGVPEAEIGRCLWRLFELDEEGIAKPLHIFHGKTFDFDVAFDLGERSQKAFDRNRWCGPPSGAITWASVTPVALDRHGKSARFDAAAEAQIAEACEHIGLPRPTLVELSSTSFIVGAPHARTMPALRRKDGSARRHVHVRLEFPEPVRGPVLIGAGRFRGYGFCMPYREEPA